MLGPWTLITAGAPKELVEPGELNCKIEIENVRQPFKRILLQEKLWKVMCCTTPHLMEEKRSFCKENDEQLGNLVRCGKQQHVAQQLHYSFQVRPVKD